MEGVRPEARPGDDDGRKDGPTGRDCPPNLGTAARRAARRPGGFALYQTRRFWSLTSKGESAWAVRLARRTPHAERRTLPIWGGRLVSTGVRHGLRRVSYAS